LYVLIFCIEIIIKGYVSFYFIKEKILLIICNIIWLAICILFNDYLPSYSNLKYSALFPPFVLLITLIGNSILFDCGLPKNLYFWLMFWLGLNVILLMQKGIFQEKVSSLSENY